MVTYGDMMGLLLCFFVILVSMSEVKEEERFQKVMESIKRAFGYQGGAGNVLGETMPNNTMNKNMQQLIMQKWQAEIGKSSEEGIEGEKPSVTDIRDGLEITIGGQVSFEAGKAVLLDQAKKQIEFFIPDIDGMNQKIRIRGHAATVPRDVYRPYSSLEDLSYARARAIKDYLIEKGIREERITVEACGDNEPLHAQAYDEDSRAINRRVSIVVMENLVEEYKGQPAENKGDIIDG
jgi:chemotaxis protein MotB